MIAANFHLVAGKRDKAEIIRILTDKGLLTSVPGNVPVGRAIVKK
jgi:hypothetical protein